MRRRPGGVAAACVNGTCGAGALSSSSSVAPEATSWNSAVSATRRQRDAPALRLQAEEPAPGRGDADRAGAVGAERGADEPGGDGRGAAAARPAGGALKVPRVARRA